MYYNLFNHFPIVGQLEENTQKISMNIRFINSGVELNRFKKRYYIIFHYQTKQIIWYRKRKHQLITENIKGLQHYIL